MFQHSRRIVLRVETDTEECHILLRARSRLQIVLHLAEVFVHARTKIRQRAVGVNKRHQQNSSAIIAKMYGFAVLVYQRVVRHRIAFIGNVLGRSGRWLSIRRPC